MTKIILVRHGHVEGISPERFRGRVDLMLTTEGRRQAEVTAHRIRATWRPAAVFTSPLSRCRATAAAIPGGETLQDVLVRALSALRGVVDGHPSDTVVLVAHDSVNRVILLHALGLPLSRYWRLGQHPCAINEIDFSGEDCAVLSMNETGHLK